MDWQRLWPKYWLQNEPTNEDWDEILNGLLNTYPVVRNGDLTVMIGPIEVWVANWPYQYGYSYTPHFRGLPRVSTRKRLRELAPPVPKLDPLEKIRALVK